jgi:hypothetical protein
MSLENPSTCGCVWIYKIETLAPGDVEIFSKKFSYSQAAF